MKHRVVRPLLWTLAMTSALSGFASGAHADGSKAAPDLASVPAPTLVGPIPPRAKPGDPSHDYVFLTPKEDLTEHGYVEEEFFIEGSARRYDTTPSGNGSVLSRDHPYRTRIVVRRPSSPKHYNGTVLLEWQNVSAGYDIDAHWGPSWEHFVRKGYAWVGVSAQRVGVHGNNPTPPAAAPTATPATGVAPAVNNGLKAWSPKRYGSLDVTAGGTVTDDSLCYDIYAQAAQAIRAPGAIDPMSGLKTKLVLAVGASQSAGRLSIYHNYVHAQHRVVDGYYLLVGGSNLRTDLGVKVFQYLSESDLRSGPGRRQDDSDTFRSWEVAGSAHSSYASEQYRTPLTLRDLPGRVQPAQCDLPPYSRVRGYYVINTQYDYLVRWISKDIAPPSAPQITFTDGDKPVIARDALGIARGGIRLPEVEVPTALNTGINAGSTFCVLYGTHQPYDPGTLQRMYPSHAEYARAVAQVAQRNARAGYISNSAAWEIAVEAALSDVPFR